MLECGLILANQVIKICCKRLCCINWIWIKENRSIEDLKWVIVSIWKKNGNNYGEIEIDVSKMNWIEIVCWYGKWNPKYNRITGFK